MKRLIILFILVGFYVPAHAYVTVKLQATVMDSDQKGHFIVKTAVKDGITYCSETFYLAVNRDKKGHHRFHVSSNRMYGEFGRGGRLIKYKRWLPGAGGSIMYMVFRYGSRIKRRVEEVMGGSAKVNTVTKGRTIHVVDPAGPVWMIILLRNRGLKSFKCINPVSGKVGTEVITKQNAEVILPQRGQVKVNIVHFGGACGEADAFLNKRGRLIGGKIGKYTLESAIPKVRRKRHNKVRR